METELFKCLLRALEKRLPGLRDEVREEMEIAAVLLAAKGMQEDGSALAELAGTNFFKSQ